MNIDLTDEQTACLFDLAKRRADGEPLQLISGCAIGDGIPLLRFPRLNHQSHSGTSIHAIHVELFAGPQK
jgi:hypothetical protein